MKRSIRMAWCVWLNTAAGLSLFSECVHVFGNRHVQCLQTHETQMAGNQVVIQAAASHDANTIPSYLYTCGRLRQTVCSLKPNSYGFLQIKLFHYIKISKLMLHLRTRNIVRFCSCCVSASSVRTLI